MVPCCALYTPSELTSLQTLRYCRQDQRTRLLLLAYLSLHMLFLVSYLGPHMFVTFTNQTLLLSTVSVALSYLGSLKSKRFRRQTAFLAAHHLVFQLVAVSSCMVVLVYWSVLHGPVMAMFTDDAIARWHFTLVHILPALSVLANFTLTDIVFKNGHIRVLPWVFALPFGLVNCAATKISGAPIYHFLTWEDWRSPAIVLGLALFATALFYVFAKLTWVVKRTHGPVALRTRSRQI